MKNRERNKKMEETLEDIWDFCFLFVRSTLVSFSSTALKNKQLICFGGAAHLFLCLITVNYKGPHLGCIPRPTAMACLLPSSAVFIANVLALLHFIIKHKKGRDLTRSLACTPHYLSLILKRWLIRESPWGSFVIAPARVTRTISIAVVF